MTEGAPERGLREPGVSAAWLRIRTKVRLGPGGCWVWTAGHDRQGYGMFWWRGRMLGAHRAVWVIFRGAVPDGLHVLHTCNVPACVSPMHLKLGTNLENVRDREACGRGKRPVRQARERKRCARCGGELGKNAWRKGTAHCGGCWRAAEPPEKRAARTRPWWEAGVRARRERSAAGGER